MPTFIIQVRQVSMDVVASKGQSVAVVADNLSSALSKAAKTLRERKAANVREPGGIVNRRAVVRRSVLRRHTDPQG